MLNRLMEFFTALSGYFFPAEERPALRRSEDYFSMVEQARLEWHCAKERFNQISDPDLIDHAIYDLEARERRYIFLLKKAREEGANIYSSADTGGG